MEPNDRTSNGEESSRRRRPPVRLAPKPALGATARLGSEVAAARAPGRVLRAATRLSPPRPGATTSEPAEAIARSVADAPAPPPAPAAERSGRGLRPRQWRGHPGRDGGLAGGLDPRGRRREGDRDVGDAAVQEAANPGSTQQGGGRSRLQRSRGARIVEGRASGSPEPAPPPAPAVAREAAEPTLPPVPGADVPPSSPSGPRKRVARSPAGSAHSEPAADTGKPSVQGPSIMRSARPPSLRGGEPATPARAAGGERPAPVKLELRRRESAPVSEPVRPRMQRAARGSVQAASVTVPVADIVVPEQVEKPGVFRRAIDALTGRRSADDAAPVAPPATPTPPSVSGPQSSATAPPSVSGPQSSASPPASVSGPRSQAPASAPVKGRVSRTPAPSQVSGPQSSAVSSPPVSGPQRRRSPWRRRPPAPSRPRPSPHRSTALTRAAPPSPAPR